MEIKPKMNVRALQALGFPLLHITLVPLTYVPSSWCRCGKRLRGFNSPTCVLTGLCCLGKTKRYLNNIFYFRPHRPTSLPKALHLTPDLKIFHEAMRQQSSGLSRGLHSALDFIQTPSSTQENTHFEKKNCFYWNSSEHQIYLVLVSKNRLYIWYWWCQNQNSDWTWWGEMFKNKNMILERKVKASQIHRGCKTWYNKILLQNINLLWKPGRIIWERERKIKGGQQEEGMRWGEEKTKRR